MSSIKVALELDDSRYTQRLKDATTAADKFAKSATDGARATEASFGKVASAADNLHGALGKISSGAEAAARSASSLVTALSGLAAVAFIQSLLSGASASKDMAEAFGLSVESVLELQAAFGAAGRGPEKLNQALATLSDTAVGALQGNYALRDSFAKLGISMQDLQTKSAKEIIQQVADVMTSGKASAAQLSATYDILGKSAKGLPWGDLNDKLQAVNGTMGPSAQAAIELDQTMKKLEATGKAVQKEFTLLLKPVAEFFNTMSSNGNGAKLMAEAIAAAMLVMGGSAVISGLANVGAAVKGLIGWFGGLTAATTTAAAATTVSVGVSSADAAARTIQAVGLGRVGTALVAVNIAQAELNALQAGGVASATVLAAAEDRLAAATTRLAVVSEAAAAAQATMTAAQGAGAAAAGAMATSTAAATGVFARLGAAVAAIVAPLATMGAAILGVIGIISAPAWATVAVAIGVITAAVTAATIVWRAFKEEITGFASAIWDKLVGAFEGVDNAITRASKNLREFFGLKPNKDLEKSLEKVESSAERLKRLGVTPNESGGRAPIMPDGSTYRPPAAPGTGDKPVGEGTTVANPMAAQEQALRDQMKVMELQNNLQREKLELQLKLVGASDAEKASRMAQFDFESKKKQDLLRIDGEIAKMQATMASGVKGEDAGKYGKQLELLKQQRKLIAENVDDTSALTGEVVKQEQAYKNMIFYREMEIKAANGVKDITQAIADLNASEDSRRIAALEKTIALEIQAAQKRAQEQKGATPLTDKENEDIAARVSKIYEGQLEAQKKLNDATRERNQFLFVQDLTNKAIEDSIRLQADMLKLTQSADQQKITDLNTQLELMIRQQIVKEQSALGRGEVLSEERQLAIRKEVMEANKGIISSTQAMIDKSREWNTGWQGAFAQYRSDAENAAMQSKQYFETFTSGMENAFVSFVQTGKLSFKDLANSLIADFARIQAKKAIAGLFSMGSGGGGGIFGSIGKIFGFAGGGEPPVNRPSLIGENGPELFVPKVAGTVVPNGEFGGGSTVNQITYNIQATDAASFKAQLARDPSFVHAVVEQGRRSTPNGARR